MLGNTRDTVLFQKRIVLLNEADVDEFMRDKGLIVDVSCVALITKGAMRHLRTYRGCKFINQNRIFRSVFE